MVLQKGVGWGWWWRIDTNTVGGDHGREEHGGRGSGKRRGRLAGIPPWRFMVKYGVKESGCHSEVEFGVIWFKGYVFSVVRQKNIKCIMGWVFLLGLWVEDNIADSLDNHISPPYKGWIWGSLDCTNNLILRSLFGARLMFEHTRTYEEETSFNLELNHLFNSSICILARSNARAFY